MREVNIYEAKASFSAVLQAVAGGEEIVITKRNKRIARLVPFQPATARPTFGMAGKALHDSDRTRADLGRALERTTKDALEACGIAWPFASPLWSRGSICWNGACPSKRNASAKVE